MRETSEPDVERDDAVARSRDTGGRNTDRERRRNDAGDPDGTSTTGVDENETFVGRVAGQDAGYLGETGAEARAETGEGGRVSGAKSELSGLEKIGYKPIGLLLGLLGGIIAGKVADIVWKRLSGETEMPEPLSDEFSTGKVLVAATLQGAIFALVKTAVDRYGLKGVRRLIGSPPRSRPRET